MAKNVPLSHVDAAWLSMEDPTNLMMVNGILMFKEHIDFDAFVDVVQHRWLRFDRFRQHVVYPRIRRPLAGPRWEFDPYFDINAHIHRVGLPSPGDLPALQNFISDLASTPLDYTKPLWQCHFIEGYEGGTVIMSRLHHAIADGIALMYVLLSMADVTPEASLTHPDEPEETQEEQRSSWGLLGTLAKRTGTAVSTTRAITSKIAHETKESITNPSHAADLAWQGTDISLAAGRLVLRSPDPQTILKGKLGVSKRVSWSHALSLADVKIIKNLCGGTVNDVLVSALTGGLRRYMIQRGAKVDGVSFRAAMPVNIRPPEKMEDLGNQFGIIYPTLPVGIDDPIQRLNNVHKNMEMLKSTPEAVVAFGILTGIGISPAEAQTRLVDVFGSKASVVMTNVPGPQLPLYIAGKELDGIMAWVPQSGRVSLGLSILSYNGKVFIGVISDEGLVPDPDAILTGFYEEFDILKELAAQKQAEKEAEPTPAQSDPDRCEALTKNGTRCKNRSLDGSPFCYIHEETAVAG
ncbi:MAG: wax ester/triacylglycerol synthase family O-acyltransferase [Anaerolineae bacterium]|nr:wax ester/triacylglycerol synthase family O-acyltransferase [Anaerolineae bacterium]